MSFSSRLKERREQLGLSRLDVANKIGVTASAIANYENNVSSPKADLLFGIFDALQCDANYLYQDDINWKYEFRATLQEQEIIKKYRNLDNYGKKNVNDIINNEYDRCNKIEENFTPYISKKHFSIGASAGNGESLIDDMYQSEILLPLNKINASADFVIDVKGNSMQPTYFNGQKVLVKKQDSIDVGEVGIFIINGESFIKELGQGKLISHNKQYQDIILNDYDDIKCVGKVLGIINEK